MPLRRQDASDSFEIFDISEALNSQHPWELRRARLNTFTPQLGNTQFQEFDCLARLFPWWGCCCNPVASAPKLMLCLLILSDYFNFIQQFVTLPASGLTITDYDSQFPLFSIHILFIVGYYGDMTYYWSLCGIVTWHI